MEAMVKVWPYNSNTTTLAKSRQLLLSKALPMHVQKIQFRRLSVMSSLISHF